MDRDGGEQTPRAHRATSPGIATPDTVREVPNVDSRPPPATFFIIMLGDPELADGWTGNCSAGLNAEKPQLRARVTTGCGH